MKNIETQIVYAACPCLWPEICSVLPLCHTYYIYMHLNGGGSENNSLGPGRVGLNYKQSACHDVEQAQRAESNVEHKGHKV